MTRVLIALGVLVTSAVSWGEQRAWHLEGFTENATPEHRAASDNMRKDMAMAPAAMQNYYLCSAITHAQLKNAEAYTQANAKITCFSDADCTIGSLGGFCPVAAHREQVEGYGVYTRSPAFKHLIGEWSKNQCFGPQGMCMGVAKAVCEKKPTAPNVPPTGVCKAQNAEVPPTRPIFMSAPKS